MFALTAHLVFASLPPCAEPSQRVPLVVEGFSAADEAWLVNEFSTWFRAQKREGCLGPGGLSLVQEGLGAWVRFAERGVQFERRVEVDPNETALFRFQVSAAGEELLRARWEAPPEPRWALAGGAVATTLVSGPVWLGPSLQASLAPLASLRLETGVRFAPLPRNNASVTGWLAALEAAVAWLPLRAGALRLGLGAGFELGLADLQRSGGLPTVTRGTAPWLGVHTGARLHIEWKRFSIAAAAEGGFVPLGINLLEEGRLALKVAGWQGRFWLRAGVRW